jgi:hypothetical protein
MNKNDILKKISMTTRKFAVKVQKHSPEILIAAGVIGTVTSAVMACKATTKIDKVLENTKERVNDIHETAEAGEVEGFNEKKELALAYGRNCIELTRLYAPAVILGTVSLTSIIASNQILKKRVMEMASAYATLDTAFKEYRSRVVERYGKDVDEELRYNIKPVKVENTITDLDTGKEKKVKSTVNVADPTINPYCMYFDETTSKLYDKNMDYNMMNLHATQQYANDKLHADGFLFLNDIYYELGIKKTSLGQKVGWIYDPNNSEGDNYVAFRYKEVTREGKDGKFENAILLDFNVDGPIIDKI